MHILLISSCCYPSALLKQLILIFAVSVQLFIHTPSHILHKNKQTLSAPCASLFCGIMICGRSLCWLFPWTPNKENSNNMGFRQHTQTVISVPCSTVGAPWYYIQLQDCKAEGKKAFSEKDIMEWCCHTVITLHQNIIVKHGSKCMYIEFTVRSSLHLAFLSTCFFSTLNYIFVPILAITICLSSDSLFSLFFK